MLSALHDAPNEAAATGLEARIRAAWVGRVSPSAVLLLNRAAREQKAAGRTDAMDDYDAAIDLDPDSVETWQSRARARFAAGDTLGAIRDEQQVLQRQPRHFGALQDLSRIAEARGDWQGALLAWQKLLQIDPRTAGAQTRLKDLRRRALGEEM